MIMIVYGTHTNLNILKPIVRGDRKVFISNKGPDCQLQSIADHDPIL